MILYYSRTFEPRYSSIPTIRLIGNIDTDSNTISLVSNGEEISDIVFRKTNDEFNILKIPRENVLEVALDFWFDFLNCGISAQHYKVEQSEVIKLKDGKVTETKTPDIFDEDDIDYIKNSLSDETKEQFEEKQSKQKVIDIEEMYNTQKEELDKQKKENKKLKKKVKDLSQWKEITKAISKGIKDEKKYDEAVDKIIDDVKTKSDNTPTEEKSSSQKLKKDKLEKADKNVQGELRKLVDFITDIDQTAFDNFIKKEKKQAQVFYKIISASEDATYLLKQKSKKRFNQISKL